MKPVQLIIVLLVFITLACNNARTGKRESRTAALYADYKIEGEEGKDSITCIFQFKNNRFSPETFLLEDPAGVQLDGTAIQPDSTAFTGVYYEIQKPLQTFTGKHTIVFTDFDGHNHTEVFDFTPIRLKTAIPQTVKRQDMVLQLEGLKPVDVIRVVMIDTAFASEDINELDTVKNGTLFIKKQQLKAVANGPITLQLFKEEERPVKEAIEKGGQLAITYSLSRDFELRD